MLQNNKIQEIDLEITNILLFNIFANLVPKKYKAVIIKTIYGTYLLYKKYDFNAINNEFECEMTIYKIPINSNFKYMNKLVNSNMYLIKNLTIDDINDSLIKNDLIIIDF
jgi:hypothetical protein